jgi:tRNA(Ile)-lysidine synthase
MTRNPNSGRRQSLVRLVERNLSQNHLIAPGDRLLAAVSGGPDSVALARILHQLAHTRKLSFEWRILHINHHLRGAEADRDEQFCRALADSLGVAFCVKHTDVPALQRRLGGSVEEVARTERLRLFRETARELDACKIAVGHQADDIVETVLHRLLRGTGLRGLSGIPARRKLQDAPKIELIRPLLPFSRIQVLDYLAEIGQESCEDSSNRSVRHTRNWIRLNLLPELEREFGPSVRQNILRLASHAAEASAFLNTAALKAGEQLIRREDDGSVCVDAGALAELPAAVRTWIISEAAAAPGGPRQGLLTVHHSAVSALLKAGAGSLLLPGGMHVSLESGRLLFAPRPFKAESFSPQPLDVPGKAVLPDGTTITAALNRPPAPPLEEIRRVVETVAYLDWDAVSPPLVVRTPRPGDRFHPLGMPGRQKLKELFINCKVPRSRRKSFPLVADQNQILWVVGLRLAEGVRISSKTQRILELRLEEAAD